MRLANTILVPSQQHSADTTSTSKGVLVIETGGNSKANLSPPFPVAVTAVLVLTVLAFVAMPILFKDRFPYRLETLGTAWGPLIFSGQWWRLFTCSFVHFDLLHVSSNMMGLWIFGVRVEREFGKWVFLLFYVMSGIAVSLGVLALRPDVASYGASGAVLSLGGGILAAYATRLRTVPRRTKIKLALLVLYFLAVVFREVARQDLYLPHTIGLLTGTILGWILVSAASKPKRQYEVFAGLAALLVSAAVLIGRYHR